MKLVISAAMFTSVMPLTAEERFWLRFLGSTRCTGCDPAPRRIHPQAPTPCRRRFVDALDRFGAFEFDLFFDRSLQIGGLDPDYFTVVGADRKEIVPLSLLSKVDAVELSRFADAFNLRGQLCDLGG